MIDDGDDGREAEWLAPVIHIGGSREIGSSTDPVAAERTTPTGADAEAAETLLLKRLRARSLSVEEARALIRPGLTATEVEILLERFVSLGYLDDRALAEQLVRAGIERKGQGRRALAITLAGRGIPAPIVASALDELPDDDAERALAFARSRLRSAGRTDREGTLRRLTGQLARRGYPSQVAMRAAREAFDERQGPEFVAGS